MALRITANEITSNEVTAWAVRGHVTDRWYVSEYPGPTGRTFNRNQAITAMTLAEERARPNPDTVLISSLEDELV